MKLRPLFLLLLAASAAGCAARTWLVPSPDHRTEVRVRQGKRVACVQVGPRKEGCYDGVAGSGLVFSADSRHVAYPARSGGKWRVVRDGVPGPSWDGVASLRFGPGGDHLAYAALDGDRWRVVRDDKAGEVFDSVAADGFFFSADGRHLVFAGFREERMHLVLDGVVGPGYDAVERVRLSADGARAAYVGRIGARRLFMLDGVSTLHDDVTEIALSEDGRHAAFVARDGSDWHVVTDGVARGPYRSARSLRLRGDGAAVFIADAGGGEFVMAGDGAGPMFDAVSDLCVSECGSRWGYLGRSGAEVHVVLDGCTLRTEPAALNLTFDQDGSRYAYIAERGDRRFVVDDKAAHSFDLVVEGSLSFCSGGVWACLAGDPERKRLFVVVEGVKERRPFRWVDVVRVTRGPLLNQDREAAAAATRAWIAAEAELLLRDGGKRSPDWKRQGRD